MILLLGASGNLGQLVLERLIKNNLSVRILSRGQDDWRSPILSKYKSDKVEVFYAEASQPEALKQALNGCDAMINTIGSLSARLPVEIEAANYSVVETLVSAANESDVQRLIQVSCLGANARSNSLYLKSKWRAEEKVKEAKAYWTIFRPSYMFGEKFPLKELLDPLVRFRPILPVIGSGLNLIQPVAYEQVADCIVLSIYDKSSVGQIYELGGPEQLTMIAFIERLREHCNVSGPSLNLPLFVAEKSASAITKIWPKYWLNPEFVQFITADSVSSRNDLKDKFGIDGQSFSSQIIR
jgi:NADH dehydrogenase